ncbi:MAG TPA: DUF4835 family protein [Phaeodactylibacter sp.]|nr:DUF4835 family protein [Phaeodactylibacter sp.]
MKYMALCLLAGWVCLSPLSAQELDVTVRVNTQKLQQADPKVFETLRNEVQEFMNNRKWTDDEFLPEERIKTTIYITLQKELSPVSFEADFGVQVTRPVYGTDYETPLLNYIDGGVTFNYEQYQPIQFSDNRYNDNLSAVLGFYAYMVLGLDYDSFSPFGGEPHFQKAWDIVNTVPESAAAAHSGWRAIDGNTSRYFFIENILSPRVRELRQAWYDYHRQGLDVAANDPASCRAIMVDALERVRSVDNDYPNAMIIQIFSDTKSSEIVEIFKKGTPQQKNKVVNIMSNIDAANSTEYNTIK